MRWIEHANVFRVKFVDMDDTSIWTLTYNEKGIIGDCLETPYNNNESAGPSLGKGSAFVGGIVLSKITDLSFKPPTYNELYADLSAAEDDKPVIESGLLSGDWKISGRIFRVNNKGKNEIFPNYSTTINIAQNSLYPEFLVVDSGVSGDGTTRTTQGVTVGLLELDEDDIMLTLVDYDDNGIFTFTGIEKDTAGNIIKFTSGKYLESGFTNESTDALNQMPTVGVVTLEKV